MMESLMSMFTGGPMMTWVMKGTIILVLFHMLVWFVKEKWEDHPQWLDTLFGYTSSFVIGVPGWVIKFFTNWFRMILALQESMIVTAKKMRSRVYQAFVVVFFLVYKSLEMAVQAKDPQHLYGMAALWGSAAVIMAYVTKKFIESRDKEHERAHEMKKKELDNGNGGDNGVEPPGPETVAPTSKKGRKGRK